MFTINDVMDYKDTPQNMNILFSKSKGKILQKIEAIRSSETSVHTKSTPHHIPEDCILHSHRCGNLKDFRVSGI
jgi:hypothetical protein